MKNIKNMSIVEENGEFVSARITFLDGTVKDVSGIEEVKNAIIQFSVQKKALCEELVRANLIKITKAKKHDNSLGGRIRVGNLSYDLTRYLVPSYKLNFGTDKRVILIADMHDYSKYHDKADALAKAIKFRHPDHVVVAGDNIQGSKWENPDSIKEFKRFLDNVSEEAPVFVSHGNHDLVGINSANVNERIKNFKSIEKGGRVHALVNDKVIIDGFEIIGYTPDPTIINGLSTQLHGLAHDRFIAEYNERGVKPTPDTENIVEFVGHNPHLIAQSENGIGLEELVPVDTFFAGHLHNGYRRSETTKNDPDKYLDRGYVERLFARGKNGEILVSSVTPYIGPTNLCRGVVYVDDGSQQRFLQLRNNHFYKNAATNANQQMWVPASETEARKTIIENKLHALVITGGIRKFFGFNLPKDEPEITEVEYRGAKR